MMDSEITDPELLADRAVHAPLLRWQLPVYSPLSLGALGAALRAALTGADPRPELERTLAADFEAAQVTLCSSGTDALQRAIRVAAGWVERGSAVALPAYSCFDVATAAIGAGLPITLYDLDPATLGPDLDSLRRALAVGARVVVVAPLYGMPVDWAALEEMAAPAGAVLIEDAAQGQGASWQGRRLGSLGRVSTLSFGRGKGWTGGRGGGLLVRGGDGSTADHKGGGSGRGGAAGTDRAILLATTVQWAIGRPGWYSLPASIPWLALGETRYREPMPGEAMTRVAAALALALRRPAAEAVAGRRSIAAEYLSRLAPIAPVRPIEPVAGAGPGYLRLAVRIRRGGSALAGTAAARRLGVAPGYPLSIAALPALTGRLVNDSGGGARSWPGAEELVRDLVTLPTHHLLSRGDRERVVALFQGLRITEPPGPGLAALAGEKLKRQ